jgi:hypothetical protein
LNGYRRPHSSQWSDECIAMASALTPILTDIIIRIIKELSSSLSLPSSGSTKNVGEATTSSSSSSISTGDDKDAKRLLQLELISYIECCAVIDIIRQQLKVAFV